jgi:hypothetical protein
LLVNLTLRNKFATIGTAVLMALPGTSASEPVLQPFSTDGCSLFPDRALIGKADWCRCCLAHDLAYWRGGSVEERLAADRDLRACVAQTTGNSGLAELMYAGVRAGGGPYFFTPYRWGYGWPFGRSYAPLSSEEGAIASALARDYLATNPSLMCPGGTATSP